MQKAKIFLSYTKFDKDIIQHLKTELEKSSKYDITIFWMEEKILNGETFSDELFDIWMQRAIENCDMVISLVTNSVVNPEILKGRKQSYVHSEIKTARQFNKDLIILKNNLDENSSNSINPLIIDLDCITINGDCAEAIQNCVKLCEGKLSQIFNHENMNTIVIKNSQLDIKNVNFVGRQKEIKQMDDIFKTSNYVILRGISGIGKTSLAKQYIKTKQIENHSSDIKCIVLDASGGIKDAIINLDLELTEEITDEKEKLKLNLKYLGYLSRRIIFVLDNCNDEIKEDELALIKKLYCKFAITTRNEQYENSFNVVEVREMDYESLYKMIDTVCEGQIKKHCVADSDVNNFINEFGGHTYAIELASAYANKFNKKFKEIHSSILSKNIHINTQHSKNLTIQQQIEALYDLNNLSEDEHCLLNSLSLFDDGMDLNEFKSYIKMGEESLEEALSNLEHLRLLKIESGYIRLHKLISEISYNKLLAKFNASSNFGDFPEIVFFENYVADLDSKFANLLTFDHYHKLIKTLSFFLVKRTNIAINIAPICVLNIYHCFARSFSAIGDSIDSIDIAKSCLLLFENFYSVDGGDSITIFYPREESPKLSLEYFIEHFNSIEFLSELIRLCLFISNECNCIRNPSLRGFDYHESQRYFEFASKIISYLQGNGVNVDFFNVELLFSYASFYKNEFYSSEGETKNKNGCACFNHMLKAIQKSIELGYNKLDENNYLEGYFYMKYLDFGLFITSDDFSYIKKNVPNCLNQESEKELINNILISLQNYFNYHENENPYNYEGFLEMVSKLLELCDRTNHLKSMYGFCIWVVDYFAIIVNPDLENANLAKVHFYLAKILATLKPNEASEFSINSVPIDCDPFTYFIAKAKNYCENAISCDQNFYDEVIALWEHNFSRLEIDTLKKA